MPSRVPGSWSSNRAMLLGKGRREHMRALWRRRGSERGLGRRDRGRVRGRASVGTQPAARRRRAAMLSRDDRALRSSDASSSSTSSSRNRVFTRWPSSTATESSTISAPLHAYGLSPRSQSRDASRLGAAKVDEEQREELIRRSGRRASDLQLDSSRSGRHLQLPEPGTSFGAMAQRYPGPSQRQLGSVEVRGDEVPIRKLHTVQPGKVEAVGRRELQLSSPRCVAQHSA